MCCVCGTRSITLWYCSYTVCRACHSLGRTACFVLPCCFKWALESKQSASLHIMWLRMECRVTLHCKHNQTPHIYLHLFALREYFQVFTVWITGLVEFEYWKHEIWNHVQYTFKLYFTLIPLTLKKCSVKKDTKIKCYEYYLIVTHDIFQ